MPLRPVAALVLVSVLAGCAAPGSKRASSGDAIEAPLTTEPADAERGRVVVTGRDGNCLLCHAIPETGANFMGNLGPPLSGIGARLTAGQLRLRMVDSRRLNPDSIMPSYFRAEGLTQVAEAYRGRTVLTELQIEDTIAYLSSLR